jgi:Leucine-rich repeat (LRR) protein
LGLDHNKIFSIPDLSALPELKEVDLGFNNLEYLPWNLINRDDLNMLIIRGNPFILSEKDKNMLKKLSNKRAPKGKSLIF